jgi:nucleoid-associated protein YgaU
VPPEKAEIQPVDGGEPIKVLFNPSQYGLDASFFLTEKAAIGGKGVVQYTSGTARTLSMELMFDTYELRSDVRDHTNRIYKLVEVKAGDHHPPIVEFKWGGFSMRCVLERVNGRFTLFLDSGVPVRATLTVSFKEYIDPKDQPWFEKRESADHTKTYVIQTGDTLSSIANAEYRDPATWRPIADANAIANPRVLVAGQRIVIPPLPDRRGSA